MTTIPPLGMGTFRLKGDSAYQAVTMALKAGFRHIDTAQMYGNESEVGRAIADSGLARDELFVTTKVWLDNLSQDRFLDSVQDSLARLGLEQVDLLLIHWPEKEGKVPMGEYLGELAKAQQAGLTRHIGVSNFTCQQIDEALAILGDGALLTNQVEVHPYLQNRTLINHCRQKGIAVTAYMPLAVGKVMDDHTLQSIAQKHHVTPAQVTLAWVLQQGLITIPSSTKQAHMEANLAAAELTLDTDDMAAIAALDSNERIADPDFAPAWD